MSVHCSRTKSDTDYIDGCIFDPFALEVPDGPNEVHRLSLRVRFGQRGTGGHNRRIVRVERPGFTAVGTTLQMATSNMRLEPEPEEVCTAGFG